MIRSMTGYGKAEETFSGMTVRVEMRSLNGKQFDVYLKSPTSLKPYEIEIRNILKKRLLRGSLDVSIQITHNEAAQSVKINTALARGYYQKIHSLAEELNLPQNDVLTALLKLPDVVAYSTEELSEKDWTEVNSVLHKAIDNLDGHRKDEGKVLESDLLLRIGNIENYQAEVRKIEPERKTKIRKRLEQGLKDWINGEKIDQNRLEQELVYYIEKLDISEEQVRLANHCRYFKEILSEKEPAKGKKLNFILQEIGREINTTGSKANDAELQRCVVQMKDELDKGKEQVMNIL